MKKTSNMIEDVLVLKTKSGDVSAFTIIFSIYFKDLVQFAARFTNDIDDAKEIVQDTFVKLWEERELIEVEVSIKAYLLTRVKNRCIDWYRHKKVIQTYHKSLMGNSDQYDYQTDTCLLYSELEELIEKTLDMLPEPVSEAFRMNRYQSYKYSEIAEKQNVSIRTVEVRIGKALKMLRDRLHEYFIKI